jgi:hypothetical protein
MTELELRLECLKLAAASIQPCCNGTNFILARAASFVTFVRQEIEASQTATADPRVGVYGPVGPAA